MGVATLQLGLLEKVNSACNVGLSKGGEEDKKLSSSGAARAKVSEAEEGDKKHLTELSTARCMTLTNNEVLSASTPPSERSGLGDRNGTELAMGTTGFFQPAGSTVEGAEMQVKDEAQSVLKQDGVIRATAAQLLQVLGKACPFVGPGLWAVKREELPPLAWQQLRRLVGEG